MATQIAALDYDESAAIEEVLELAKTDISGAFTLLAQCKYVVISHEEYKLLRQTLSRIAAHQHHVEA